MSSQYIVRLGSMLFSIIETDPYFINIDRVIAGENQWLVRKRGSEN